MSSETSPDQPATYPSLVDSLRRHATERADQTALIVLIDGETEQDRLTYAQLDARVRTVAARMQRDGLAGERVLLMLPTRVEYVIGFLACLYAGAVPVPLNPPTRSAHRDRIDHVVVDCQPRLAIVPSTTGLMEHLPTEYGCQLWAADELEQPVDHEWTPPVVAPGDLAYLQYTSGSTSQPKGVMVTQENLVHQLVMFFDGLQLDPRHVSMSWLPLHHDFGLVAGLLMPLRAGGTTVLMPPTSFVQRPLRWLRAISEYGAYITYGPNFPLDLCCDLITEEERRGLDLSRWGILTLGAEPIRPDSLDRFAAAFAGCGFRASTFRIAYGMAETTLALTLQPPRPQPRIIDVDVEEFGRGVLRVVPPDAPGPRRQRLVSAGTALGDTELIVVDPETRQRLPEGREGEIWLRGRTVAAGYWQRPAESEETFGARLADGTGPYLRSGDLGALLDGEIYLTSRRKDLIIIRGRNHHPSDIELTVGEAHRALARGSGVAFSVDADGEERLVVVQEIKRTELRQHDLSEVARLVRTAVAEEHEVIVDTVVFLRPAALPKTTSGKVRRQYTKKLYLDNKLRSVHVDTLRPQPTAAEEPVTGQAGPDRDAIARWLAARVGALTGRPGHEVPLDVTFGGLGLDSALSLRISGELARWLGRPVDPTLLYAHPTIGRFAAAVAGSTAPAAAGQATGARGGTGPAADREPLAVVGMAGVFPGADSVDQFWSLLTEGRTGIGELPATRAAGAAQPGGDAAAPGENAVGRAGFLADVAGFDARFFGVSAEEAAAMDPQQRLLLTTVWRALEDAGIPVEAIAGTAGGVFIGITTNDYRQLMVRDQVEPGPYTGTGTSMSIAAGRISYFLDLRGPALAIDTACSSSLVAVHNAALSLRRGECDLAIVGGVNLLLDPELTEGLRQAGMMSATGLCRTFDSGADGYVRGEGCGVIVLKRHADAVRDNDRIRALVVGSAINQDGHSNTLTAPNTLAQQAVMRQALDAAGMSPDEVGYLEAHGTGTPLGDPIEISGIKAVYGATGTDTPLWIGSVKTNIGHLEAAAGIAGLIKAVLALEHGVIPPHLHLNELNPLITLDGTRCRIPTDAQPWPADPQRPRAAAVSSFGFSGTNAHVILRAAPQPAEPTPVTGTETTGGEPVSGDGQPWRILPLSARSDWALGELADRMVATLAAAGETPSSFAQLCRAAARRRSQLPHRTAVVARSAAEAAQALREHQAGTPSAYVISATARDGGAGRTAWLFPGQGFQRLGMATPYHDRYQVFRDAVVECDRIIRADLGVSLLPSLVGAPGEPVDLDETGYGQPAMFVVQYALARIWQEAGATPDFLVGHSLGEFVAACLAGVLSLDDALGLVLLRARLMQRTEPGVMYAVHTEHLQELRAELADDGEVVLAAVNGPADVTISGTPAGTERVAQRWAQRGAKVTRLNVRRAFHSPLMDPVIDEFARGAAQVRHNPARVPVVSTRTGELLADGLTGEHWVRQLREPVLFESALQTLGRLEVRQFIELSPEPVLSPLGPRTVPGASWLTCGGRRDPDDRRLVLALAEWHTRGGALNWSVLDEPGTDRPPYPVALPGHPLRATRHWYTPGASRPVRRRGSGHPLLGSRVDVAGASREWFSAELTAEHPWFIDQHRVSGVPLLPGTAMIEWALAAAGAVFGASRTWTLDDIRFTTALALPAGRSTPVQAVVDPATGSVACFARNDADAPWVPRAQVGAARPTAPAVTTAPAPEQLLDGLVEQDVAELYARLTSSGIDYGPAFRGVRRLWRRDDEAVGRIIVDLADHPGDGEYLAHPVVLDACLHVAGAFLPELSRPLVPVAAAALRIHDRLPADVWCHARWSGVRDTGDHLLDLRVLGAAGEVVLEIDGLTLRPLPESALIADAALLRRQTIDWVPVTDPVTPADLDGRWLVLSPDAETGQRWREALSSAGASVSVLVADGQAPIAQDLAALRAEDPALAGVVVVPDESGTDDVYAFAELARRTVLPVGQVLAAFPASRPTVVICSRQAAALPGRATRLTQGALTGLATALTAEYPDLRVVQVDTDVDAAPQPREILDHALSGAGSGRLAVTGGQWWQARLTAERLTSGTATVHADATYLITGGWGALGRVVTGQLARLGARHLVLVGRTAPQPLPQWLAELTADGVQVLLREVDLADGAAVNKLFAELAELMPPVRGVVHAAGGTDDAPLTELTWPRFEGVLGPKAYGAWHLHRCTRELSLDFFVLFSSFASLVGSSGQANYVLANAFLDALAAVRRHEGLPAISLNWGPWSEGGIAVRSGVLPRLARSGLFGITDTEGATALTGLLTEQLGPDAAAQVGLAKVDWDRFAQVSARKVPYTLLADLSTGFADSDVVTTSADLRELALTDPTAAERELVSLLLREAAVLLGFSAADREELRDGFAEARFSTLGFDSLMAMRLRNRLLAELSVELPNEFLFDGSTVGDVARWLGNQLAVHSVVADADEQIDGEDVEVLLL